MVMVGDRVRHGWDGQAPVITGLVVRRLGDDRWVVQWDPPAGLLSAVCTQDVVVVTPATACAQPG